MGANRPAYETGGRFTQPYRPEIGGGPQPTEQPQPSQPTGAAATTPNQPAEFEEVSAEIVLYQDVFDLWDKRHANEDTKSQTH